MIDISIIIPAYNSLTLLQKSLNSIIDQKDIKLEVIVVDDSTNSIIFNYLKKINSNKVKYYKNISKKGAVSNWNYGLSLAKGKYITILHHDELYEDSINQISNLINNKDSFEIIISRVKVLRPDNSYYFLSLNKHLKKFILNKFPSFLFFMNFIGPVSCVIFKNNQKIFFNDNLKWFVDVDWYYRLFKNRKVKYVNDKVIISLVNHQNKISSNIDVESEMNSDFNCLSKVYFDKPLILFLIKLYIVYKKYKFKFT